MTPSISIVTPCLNMGRFLDQCISSVLDQSYPGLEFLVIDGGSSDKTLDVVRRHSDRIAYWVTEPDRGQTHAINKGLERAHGDVVAWLNADDYFLPGAFNAVASAYAANPDAPFYFGDGVRVDEQGRFKAPFFPGGAVRFSHAALLNGLNYILQPAAFINRRHLEVVGLLDETLHYGMDSDLWMRLIARGRPATIQRQLAASREYDSTKTSTGSFDRIEELRRIARRYTGQEMTPGVLCYLFDEMLKYANATPQMFSARFSKSLVQLWAATSREFHRFGARPDGFPLSDDDSRS
jgi:glycosyltransferase involved in cell wall biosynthesis